MTRAEFRMWCIHKHDVECNQRYDGNLLYSKHLEYVVCFHHRFKHLIPDTWADYAVGHLRDSAEAACWGHDLIEDARVTYNDLKDRIGEYVADLIYACTEEKGRDRDERHSEKYYKQLAENKVAVFVKLCDICANVTYSVLTNSSMYHKHKKEHTKTMAYLYVKEYEPIYDYLDKMFSLWD